MHPTTFSNIFIDESLVIIAVFGGEYTVIYSPQYVKFRQTSTSLDANEIDALITSIYGLTASKVSSNFCLITLFKTCFVLFYMTV